MKFLSQLKDNKEFLKNKRVIVRVDFNVPIQDGEIVDSYRIDRVLPTIDFLLSASAKVLIFSHIESDSSLEIVHSYLSKKYKTAFIKDYYPSFDQTILEEDKQVFLFENIRQYSGEKNNDQDFAQYISSLGDIYVNEAFSASHRDHASIVSVPKNMDAYAGFIFEEEVKGLSKAINFKAPLLFVIGGAKFETKRPLIEKFYKKAKYLFVGGALANDFIFAKGFEVGKSLKSSVSPDVKLLNESSLLIPEDVVVSSKDNLSRVCSVSDVTPEETIVDIGPKSTEALISLLKDAKTVIWNGPLGNYEKGFSKSTEDLAHALSKLKDVEIVIGGGDTVASMKMNKLGDNVFVSTAGGAMLEYLLNETLPGIDALS